MGVTGETTIEDLDEALVNVRASRDVAARCGELAIQLRCAEEIDELLEHRHRLATAATS